MQDFMGKDGFNWLSDELNLAVEDLIIEDTTAETAVEEAKYD